METVRMDPLEIVHGSRRVDGVLYSPQQEGVYPAVIFSHGYNGHKSDFDSTARFLAEHDICAIAFNFCGGSVRDESGMPTTDMTLFTEADDLRAVISFAKRHNGIDSSRIFVFGGSQGGLVTALTVDDMSEEIKGMILLYPAFCIADDWNSRFPDVSDIPEKTEFWGMTLGRGFFESLHGYDVYAHVGEYENNVLIMHGDQDPIVTTGCIERATEAYRNVRLEVFPGEGHGFTCAGTQRMTGLLHEFVLENI